MKKILVRIVVPILIVAIVIGVIVFYKSDYYAYIKNGPYSFTTENSTEIRQDLPAIHVSVDFSDKDRWLVYEDDDVAFYCELEDKKGSSARLIFTAYMYIGFDSTSCILYDDNKGISIDIPGTPLVLDFNYTQDFGKKIDKNCVVNQTAFYIRTFDGDGLADYYNKTIEFDLEGMYKLKRVRNE